MPKQRRVINDEEGVDTKKHSLADLALWQPPGENTLQRKWEQRREQQLLDNTSTLSMSEDCGGGRDGPHIAIRGEALRVVMNDEGELVLDEESAVVPKVELEHVWETGGDVSPPHC